MENGQASHENWHQFSEDENRLGGLCRIKGKGGWKEDSGLGGKSEGCACLWRKRIRQRNWEESGGKKEMVIVTETKERGNFFRRSKRRAKMSNGAEINPLVPGNWAYFLWWWEWQKILETSAKTVRRAQGTISYRYMPIGAPENWESKTMHHHFPLTLCSQDLRNYSTFTNSFIWKTTHISWKPSIYQAFYMPYLI